MKKFLSSLLVILLLIGSTSLLFTSCDSTKLYFEGEGELNVLCTIFAPFDFARNVGGDRITNTILQDNGADLHNYTPTSATLDALNQADVFIYVGGVSDEAWVDDAIKASGNSDLLALCLMDVIEPIHAELSNDWSEHNHDHEEHEDSHDGHDHGADEHVWTSLRNAKAITNAIKNAFIEKDPLGADTYEANASAYCDKLDLLDSRLSDIVAKSPSKTLIFADRFPFVYLMHDYHVAYTAAFSGCSTEVNASFETQVNLINEVKNNSLSCVITIEGGDKTLAEAISNETGCKILSLNSMQSVKRADIINGADYIKIMEENINVLEEALQ